MHVKLQKVGFRERSDPATFSPYSSSSTIIGRANKGTVTLDGKDVLALLDTGSMVSTMAASLQTTLGLEVHKLDYMLTVEGAVGHRLPYLGYVEVDLYLKQMEEPAQRVIMLVVPDTAYHQHVPV